MHSEAVYGILLHDADGESHGIHTDCMVLAAHNQAQGCTEVHIKSNGGNTVLAQTIAALLDDIDRFMAKNPGLMAIVAALRGLGTVEEVDDDT